jgi:hypothetical protein
MICPNSLHITFNPVGHQDGNSPELTESNIKGYYTCKGCKSVWYISKVGELH